MNEWSYESSLSSMGIALNIYTLQCCRVKAKLKMLNDTVAGKKFIDPNTHPIRQGCINIKYQYKEEFRAIQIRFFHQS